jgi:hypothetical protein
MGTFVMGHLPSASLGHNASLSFFVRCNLHFSMKESNSRQPLV